MSSKSLRFPMRVKAASADTGLPMQAAEEVGYGICLSLYFLIKPRVLAVLRPLSGSAKPEFANSSLFK